MRRRYIAVHISYVTVYNVLGSDFRFFCLGATVFDAAGAVRVVIGLSLPGMFFTHQPVEVVVLVAAVGEDVGQDGVVATPGLFVLQAAVAVVAEFGVQLSLAT